MPFSLLFPKFYKNIVSLFEQLNTVQPYPLYGSEQAQPPRTSKKQVYQAGKTLPFRHHPREIVGNLHTNSQRKKLHGVQRALRTKSSTHTANIIGICRGSKINAGEKKTILKPSPWSNTGRFLYSSRSTSERLAPSASTTDVSSGKHEQ